MRMKNYKKAATYHQLIPECCPRSQLHKCGGWPKMSNHPGCVNVIWWTTTASRMFVKVMDPPRGALTVSWTRVESGSCGD